MANTPQASASLVQTLSGNATSPIRRHTLPSEVKARFSDTIGWSPKGFQPELLSSPMSEEAPEFPQPGSELIQPISRECHHLDSNAELWKSTLERAMKGIVSIKYTTLRAFDMLAAGSFGATGFVVDRTKGIILSNRHVVTPGPTTSMALFNKYEELPLVPIYFDPVHDFGFFKYDPSKIKFGEIEEIMLCPEAAKVGMEIKICGSDAGEHLSILSSTLARLDRPAPYYGDFNTFYFQAASGSSGGSSGSPVLDIYGRAVALNVGGVTNTASSFFLPLDRVLRALKLLQKGKQIPRGTLQTEFIHASYDELKKLGITDEIEMESRKRNKHCTGLLTVRTVLPEGPGSKALQVGDIVVKCYHPAFGEKYVENFISLWEIIDECIGDVISLTVLRGNEQKLVEIRVQDLNSIIPDKFLDIGQATVHPISYQIARLFHLPCRGLFLASGMCQMPRRPILMIQLDDKNVNSLDELVEVLQSIPDGKRVSVRYRQLGSWGEEFNIVDIDYRFFPMALFKRNDGIWERTVLKPHCISEPEPKTLDLEIEATWRARLRSCLLRVSCQGLDPQSTIGVGVLVAVEPTPLIVVSRTIIPVSTCDIWITIGNHNLSGCVVYLGIVTIVTINGTSLRGTDVLPICMNEYKVGDRLEIFALDKTLQLVQLMTEISEIAPIESGPFSPPRWRMKNIEAIYSLAFPKSDDGLLIEPYEKSVVALWIGIEGRKFGLDYNRYIRPIVEDLKNGKGGNNRCCGWVLGRLPLSDAIHLGLNSQRASQIVALSNVPRIVPSPIHVTGKLRPFREDNLRIGDIILEVNRLPVIRMADINNLCRLESSQILILRNRQEMLVNLDTVCLPSELMSRIIFWSGTFLHETHDSALEQITPEFEEISRREGITNIWQSVYIDSIVMGSPAFTRLPTSSWILEVDDYKVRTMDDMLHVISTLQNQREHLRVKTIGTHGNIGVRSIRPDHKFWPTWILERKDEQWVRTELE